jgi:hypothetical protein
MDVDLSNWSTIVILSEHESRLARDEGESTCPGVPWKDPEDADNTTRPAKSFSTTLV